MPPSRRKRTRSETEEKEKEKDRDRERERDRTRSSRESKSRRDRERERDRSRERARDSRQEHRSRRDRDRDRDSKRSRRDDEKKEVKEKDKDATAETTEAQLAQVEVSLEARLAAARKAAEMKGAGTKPANKLDAARQLAAKFSEKLSGTKDTRKSIFTAKTSAGDSVTFHPKGYIPPPLRLDKNGREIDEHGNLIQREKDVRPATLKVNVNRLKQQRVKEFEKSVREAEKVVEQTKTSIFYDPTSNAKLSMDRKPRPMMKFYDEGTFQARAQRMRERALKDEIAAAEAAIDEAKARLVTTKTTGDADGPDSALALLASSLGTTLSSTERGPPRPVPNVEWWDSFLLPEGHGYAPLPVPSTVSVSHSKTDDGGEAMDTHMDTATTQRRRHTDLHWDAVDTALLKSQTETKQKLKASKALWKEAGLSLKKVTHYIEHPIPTQPPTEQPVLPLPVMLTKKEKKKLRHRSRVDRQQEQRDKIRLGLMEPPKPKSKLSNFMRVMGDDAIQDPTAIEGIVKEEVSQRQIDHLRRNEERKLTDEQRKEKNAKKYVEDTSTCVTVSVFKIDNLSHRQKIFKVLKNAQQFNLSGVALVCRPPGMCLVVVEGGSYGIDKFTHLMMERIDWCSNPLPDDGDGVDEETAANWNDTIDNECKNIWFGYTPQKVFRNFKVEQVATEPLAKRVLRQRGVDNYWNRAATYKNPE